MANTTQTIYDGCGRWIGWIDIDERGNKRVCSCAKGVVGYYYKDTNRTVTAGGKIIAYCDSATALLYDCQNIIKPYLDIQSKEEESE